MSESQSLHVDPGQFNPEFLSDKSPQELEQGFKKESEKALKQSLNGNQFDVNKANEQLGILKEASPTQQIKDKLDHLIQLINRDAPQHINQIHTLLEAAFIGELVANQQQEGVNVSLNHHSPNPFKPDNPFAPKVISSANAQSSNNHSSRDRKEKEQPPKKTKKKKGFWASLLNAIT